MKAMKLSLVIMAAALLTLGLSGMAYAFHSGGVAACDGCHTMHGVFTPGGAAAIQGKGPNLLVGTDPSSTCLLCHGGVPTGSANIGGGPKVMTYPFPANLSANYPTGVNVGGDFAWLQRTYGTATSTSEYGQTHGHNVVAMDFNMFADPDYPGLSPGGNFLTNTLACNSCHDPHGTYRRVGDNTSYQIGTPTQLGVNSHPISGSGSGSSKAIPTPTPTTAVGTYRLLAGNGYAQTAGGAQIGFPGAPIAISTSTAGGTESTSLTQFRVAYANVTANGVTPWGQWCGACHSQMLSASASTHKHPVDVPLSGQGIDLIYNSYVSTGNLTGTSANSYLSLVPFMESQTNITTLAGHAGTGILAGPAGSDQVSCRSCHRAHASAFKYMLNWDMNSAFLTDGTPNWSIVASKNITVNEANQAYYGRPAAYFGAFQRVLCNKCHAKD